MSEHNAVSAPIHRTLENLSGATGTDLTATSQTTQICRPHTNSIESNKSGRVSSIPNGASCGLSSLGTNRPKVLIRTLQNTLSSCCNSVVVVKNLYDL